jgi:S-DNA-T family DNA segregation ATPase FtsK/SpoIIIE
MGRSKKRTAGRTRRVVTGVLLSTIAALVALSIGARLEAHFSPPGESLGEPNRLQEVVGWFGRFLAVPILRVTGLWVGLLLPFACAALGARLVSGRRLPGTGGRALLFAATLAVLASAISSLFVAEPASPDSFGALLTGAVGPAVLGAIRAMFGRTGAVVVLAGASACVVLAIGLSDARLVRWLRGAFSRAASFAGAGAVRAAQAMREDLDESRGSAKKTKAARPATAVSAANQRDSEDDEDEDDDEEDELIDDEELEEEEADEDEEEPEDAEPRNAKIPPSVPVVVLPSRGEPAAARNERPTSTIDMLQEIQTDPDVPYEPPPEDFLERDSEESSAAAHEELLAGAKTLEKALRDFGVKGKVTQVQPGPLITRFEVEPAPGQKVAPIANLSDDLALALKARTIRIVAPIPGKAAVGIEVPNPRRAVVRLGPLLQSPEFRTDTSPLTIALGRNISGDPYCAALDRMPHLLVAGATGAGKSVCINTIITSIVYRAGPERVRFVMIDPKMLELMTYVGLPHLIPPVVTQPKEVARILKWAVAEMETRYRQLAHSGVRSIVDFNARQEEEGAPPLPYLVVIVDELADLMLSTFRGEIEESIARLAQMARAVGIHLVVATQRPSVDVITGVIKANFPSRIAFQVPTRTDSRTILDSIGAERLLGRGDMLYLGVGMSAPLRIHGSFVSTEETTDIVEWLKTRHPRAEAAPGEAPAGEEVDLYPRERDDELFEESARIIVAHQQGSVSLLQRRLKVGYARAARLVDMLEEAGVVGAFTGSKARDVLVPNLEELEKKLASRRPASLGAKTGP